MPFSVADCLQTLNVASGGRVGTAIYDDGIAIAITSRIRELDAKLHERNGPGLKLEDVRLCGEFIAARWTPGIDLGPEWVATSGKLAATLGNAQAWHERGRPPRNEERRLPGQPKASQLPDLTGTGRREEGQAAPVEQLEALRRRLGGGS